MNGEVSMPLVEIHVGDTIIGIKGRVGFEAALMLIHCLRNILIEAAIIY